MSKMTRFLSVTAFVAILALGAGTAAQADSITQAQISTIIAVLRSFNIDQATLTNVENILNGRTGSAQACRSYNADLSVGARSADVTGLQQLLIANRYSIPAGATGYYGAQTKAAVMAYQRVNGLSLTGIADASTRAKINLSTCPAPANTTNACRSGDIYNMYTGARCVVSSGSRSGGGGGGSGGGSAPTVSLSASATSVASGQSVTLTWSSNAVSCSFTNFGSWSADAAPQQGSGTITVTGPVTVTLTCKSSTGQTASYSVGLSITTPQQPVTLRGQLDYNDSGYVDSTDSIVLQDLYARDVSCPSGKFCDINNDGVAVSEGDLIKFMMYVSPPVTYGALDYNNDGVVDNQDSGFLGVLFASDSNACPSGKLCDMNGDRVITAEDPALLNGKITQYDYNGDGKLSYLDRSALINIVTKINTCPSGKVCDVNGDNAVNSSDVTKLGQLVGMPPVYGQIDYTNDGRVDSQDITYLQTRRFAPDASCPAGKFCDFNNDGASISAADMNRFVLYVTGQ